MRIIKTLLLWLAGLITVFVVAIVAWQSYYAFTPRALSSDVASLEARAQLRPEITENGYRLYGLLAPAEVAPEQYGKCRFRAEQQQRAESKSAATPTSTPLTTDQAAYKAYLDQYNARTAALMVPCLRGGVAINLPKQDNELRVRLGITPKQWALLAANTPDPLLIKRAESVWADGPRRLGAAPDSPIPEASPLLQVERWRIAQALQKWQAGARSGALSDWDRSTVDWIKSADDTLIDAMLSASIVTQIQLAMQHAFTWEDRVDDASAQAAMATLARMEALPTAVGDSLLGEWQLQTGIVRSLIDDPGQWSTSSANRPGLFGKVIALWTRYTYDLNDTLNHMARNFASARAATEAAARCEQPAAPEPPTECQTKGEWTLGCLVLSRNPGGRILVALGAPDYSRYGVRVADVRNLAAATRLTVEARRRGLSGEALTQFVANAPDGMRDVFTRQAFSYDASKRQLKVELREKSTVLGDAGSYLLML